MIYDTMVQDIDNKCENAKLIVDIIQDKDKKKNEK